MNKLPVDIKKKWVDALRSGKYEQGREYLCDGDRYCCLGVLQKELDGCTTPMYDDSQLPSMTWAYEHGLVEDPSDREEWNPRVKVVFDDFDFDGHVQLSELNDSGDFSFNQIADLIEEQL